MCEVAETDLVVAHLDEVPLRLEVVGGRTLLAQPVAARAAIIQGVTAMRERTQIATTTRGMNLTLTPASQEAAWLAVGWDDRRALVVPASAAGRVIAAWARREVGRFRDFARTEAALDAVGEGLVVIDGMGRVAHCTRRAAELLGASEPEQIEAKLVSEAIPQAVVALEPHEVARGAIGRDREVSYIAQHPAPASGESESSPGVVLRLRGQERFLATRRGQLQLLSALRHDVRSPLTALRGLVGVLQEEPDMPRDERVQLVDLLHQEAERTVTWCEDYLVLLRLRFEPRPVSPARIGPDVPLGILLTQYAQHARDRDITFSTAIDPLAAATLIEADPSLLEPFCKNLVGHFLRLADSGATIAVRIEHDGALVVEGQGPGLFTQHPAHPFTTLARSTAAGKRTPGVGLGLFLAKRIADVHGWPITVTSDGQSVRAVVRWAVVGALDGGEERPLSGS